MFSFISRNGNYTESAKRYNTSAKRREAKNAWQRARREELRHGENS